MVFQICVFPCTLRALTSESSLIPTGEGMVEGASCRIREFDEESGISIRVNIISNL
ncbi:MAG TPA: hypothetical protein VMS89_06820 [Methanoregulaceae archaeon]|nr:hypothetical protein [Methanoregulaceae archaeon]